MTTPATPPISMAQVRAEFGGSAGIAKLSDYVLGGAFVPETSINSGVPSAPPIRLAQLCSRNFWGPSASPNLVTGHDNFLGYADTADCTAFANGLTGTITYTWQRVSGDPTMTCLSPSAQITKFRGYIDAGTPLRQSVWRCYVTGTLSGFGSVTGWTKPITARVTYP